VCGLQEIPVAEAPQLITLVDSSGSGTADNHICVAYRHQFDLVNERTGELSLLLAVEGSQIHLVAAIGFYEDEEPKLLLCYNRKRAIYPAKSSCNINLSLLISYVHSGSQLRLIVGVIGVNISAISTQCTQELINIMF
jgi:hypothetical protein